MILRILEFILGFLAIGLIVFLHELGHYAAARFFHVDVEVLSYGMGPKIFSIYGKNTEFRLSLFPFGGYCRMKGSIDLEKALRDEKESILMKEDGSYFAVSPAARIMIYLFGPLTNYIIAFLLLFAAAIIPVERISNPAIVTPISEYPELFDSDIKQTGIMKGDLVLEINGMKVLDYQDMSSKLSLLRGPASLRILRSGEVLDVTITPEDTEDGSAYGLTLYQAPVIGDSSVSDIRRGDRIVSVNGKAVHSTLDVYSAEESGCYDLIIERDGSLSSYTVASPIFPFSWDYSIAKRSDVPLSHAFGYALHETNDFITTILKAIGALITLNIKDARTVITGPVNAAESIGSISTEAFKVSGESGIRTMLYLLAIVSVSISVANILPIPTFDGGQILICIAEMIRHGGLKAKTYVHLQLIGMLLALLIMAGMYYFDIKEYFF